MSVLEEWKHCRLGVDRISRLPDNVIDKILTSLPIVEAAKTSVLSRDWKLRWNGISSLKFDSSFGIKFETAGRPSLMLAICQTLMHHSGTIHGFTLSIPWLESCSEISTLIQFLSGKKIQRLKIHFTKGDLQILPYLFSCLHLTYLGLCRCVLSHPCRFGGFNKLMKLKLDQVQLPNNFFEMFIPNCPLLKDLWLSWCIFKEASCIKITALNLRRFIYYGRKMFFYFTSVPLLDTAIIFYHGDFDYDGKGVRRLNFDGEKKLGIDKFLIAVPSLGKLAVNNYLLKILEFGDLSGESSQPPNCLHQVKHLWAQCIGLADVEEVSSLLKLIRSSPNLETFTVWIHNIAAAAPVNPFEILGSDQCDFSCERLERVELHYFNGTDSEMWLVRFLLSRSPQLKTVTICRKSGMDDQEWMQIRRKVFQFKRASADVNIILSDVELF